MESWLLIYDLYHRIRLNCIIAILKQVIKFYTDHCLKRYSSNLEDDNVNVEAKERQTVQLRTISIRFFLQLLL